MSVGSARRNLPSRPLAFGSTTGRPLSLIRVHVSREFTTCSTTVALVADLPDSRRRLAVSLSDAGEAVWIT